MDIDQIRREYLHGGLSSDNLQSNPIGQFQHWLQQAVDAKVQDPTAMSIATNAETGHTVVIEGPPSHGGRNTGVRPMELLLLGLGGCTSFDVMNILGKSRQRVTDCVAELVAERSDDVPSVFTKIAVHFKVTGKELKEAAVARAVSLSAEKFCSASIMLEKGGVEISHSFEIIAAE